MLGNLWPVITVLGVVILGAALAYGAMRSRKTTPAAEAVRDAATRAEYHKDEPAPRPAPALTAEDVDSGADAGR